MHVHQCQHVADSAANIPPFHTIEPRFLSSDYVPSEIEISLLKDVLKERAEEIKRYKEDIGILVDRLEKANSTTRQCQAAISACRRIPVEIWEMIFSALCLSLHEYSFDIKRHSPLLGLPATILSQVCSHWRMIAKGLPRLWSSIKVNLFEPPHDVAIPLNVYFSNLAQSYPLKIRIEGLVHPSNPSRGLDVWRVLSRHIHRSRELTIAVDDISRTLPPIQHLTFPNLESFYEKEVPLDGTPWLWFWQAIQEAPKLAMVSSSRFRPSIPFSQLIVWEVPYYLVEVNNFLDVLQRCKRLVSLTLLNLSNSGSPVAAREVELPSLRRLSVSVYRDEIDPLSSILQSLVMPSLETCKISFERWTLPPALLTMVRRCSTTLKQITINVLPDGDTMHWLQKYLIDMLQTACELTHFELYVGNFHGGDDCIKVFPPLFDTMISTLLLKLRDDHHTFLPKLDALSFHFPSITLNRQLVMRILEAVSARQRTLYPLTEFRLTRSVRGRDEPEFVVESEFVERIQMLKESGIKVVVEDL